MGFFITLIVLAVVLWALIAAAGALPLLMLSRVELQPVDEIKSRKLLRKVLTSKSMDPSWVVESGFRPVGVFQITGQIGDPHMVAWQRDGENTFLCVYVLQGDPKGIDIVTILNHGGLTTGSSKDGHAVPPRPDRWVQTFSVASVADQYRQHEAALAFLREATGQIPRRTEGDTDFPQEFVSNVRGHAAHIRSLPLWFLRIPYWYFVRRKRLHNKTVREQLEQQRAELRQFTAE